MKSICTMNQNKAKQSMPATASKASHSRPRLSDHICGLLRDHNRRRVGVSRDNGRHDGGVHHAQIVHAVDAQLRVDDGGRVVGGAHLAGAHRVVDRLRHRPRHAGEVLIAEQGVRLTTGKFGLEEAGAEALHRRRLRYGNGQLHALHHGVNVLRVGEVPRVDDGVLMGIGRAQPDEASALRAQHHRVHGEGVRVLKGRVHLAVHAVVDVGVLAQPFAVL